jgi:hypothetical protein
MKFSNLALVSALSLLSLNSISFANTSETLVKCSAKITSSTNAVYAQVGSVLPLDIEFTHVDADASSTGKAFDEISFQLGSGDTFLAGGDVGKEASVSSDSITLDESSYFNDSFESIRETYNFDKQTRSLTATWSKLLTFDPNKVTVTAQCE